MFKNTASQSVGAQMITAADGSAFTGSVTVAVTGDSGTQAAGTVGSAACTHEGGGYHSYRPSQAETNYDHVAYTFSGTGAIPVTIQVFTRAGDAFTRLGAPAGASVSADMAAVKAETATILADTNDIQTRLPAALVSGRMDSSVGAMAANVLTAAAINADAITAAKVAADVGTEIGTAVWATTTRELTALDEDNTTIDINNTAIGSVVGTVGSVTGNVGGNVAGSVASVTAMVTANVIQISGDSGAADNLETAFDNTAGPVRWLSIIDQGFVQSGSGTSVVIRSAAAFAADELIGATFIVVAGTGIGQRALIDDNDASDGLTLATALVTALDGTSFYQIIPTAASPAGSGDCPTAAEIADAVWDEDLTGHTTPDSAGDTLGSVATGTPPTAAAIADAVWDEARSGHATSGTFGAGVIVNSTAAGALTASSFAANAIDAAALAADAVAEIQSGLSTLTQANVRSAVGLGSANLDTQLDALPTNAELATALGTADDAVLAAIAALNNLSQANVRSAVGLASANLDTQLDALPTNAELSTALGTADDAVLAAIAALNNLSQANVRSAVGLGSANLDTQLAALPTAAENTADLLGTSLAELTGDPGAAPALKDAIMLLFMAVRNRRVTTETDDTIHNSAGSDILTATISDDGTEFIKGKFS